MEGSKSETGVELNDESPASRTAGVFLSGGGEMGELIREYDWTATLGPPRTWSQSLRTVVRLMLSTHHPVFIFWGPDSICLYNDAYSQSMGHELHPRMLGACASQVWEPIWDIVGPQIELARTGRASWHEDQCIPLVKCGALEETFWTYSCSPIDDETAATGIGGVLVVCEETTHKVLVRRHQAFRLQLEAALRDLQHPGEILSASTALLGEFLRASRCGYGDVGANTDLLVVRSEWTNIVSLHRSELLALGDFGPAFIARYLRGAPIAVEEPLPIATRRDPQDIFSRQVPERTGIAMPLVRNGRLVAVLYVYRTGDVRWSSQDELLVGEVAERTLETIERARAAMERDRMTMALRESEARYRLLVEASSAIVWEMPASGEFTAPQPGWTAFTGQEYAELQGWGWLNAVHPDDQDRTTEVLGRAFETRSDYELEYRLRRSDGEYCPMKVRAIAVMNSDQSLRGWIGIHNDLSPTRAVEAALRESKASLSQATDNSPTVTWTATGSGRLERISDRWREWTGLSGAIGWEHALHPDEQELVLAAWANSRHTGMQYDMEHRVRQANGEYRWVHAHADPRRDAAGKIFQWVGTIEDIHDWLINHDIHQDQRDTSAAQFGMPRS